MDLCALLITLPSFHFIQISYIIFTYMRSDIVWVYKYFIIVFWMYVHLKKKRNRDNSDVRFVFTTKQIRSISTRVVHLKCNLLTKFNIIELEIKQIDIQHNIWNYLNSIYFCLILGNKLQWSVQIKLHSKFKKKKFR